MRVLVAPDKFRGTLTAMQAARAIETGWLRTRPEDLVATVPMADGGEGTLDALVDALKGEITTATVPGPLGDPVRAEYGVVPTPDGPMAIVEMARASGLALVSEKRRDPLRASTRGTGELIRDAIGRHQPVSILVCIGGSATTDGGAGAAQAMGARLLDGEGADIPPGGSSLAELARIDLAELPALVLDVRFVVASDVDNPLVGPQGAAAVYGPQKGATPEDVAFLDRALGHYAAVIDRDLGLDLRTTPGAGAAGGLGAGLIAFTGAHLRPGVDVVMDAVGLRERLAESDVVLTGEGRLDSSSLHGKTVAGISRAAREAAVPVGMLCGRVDVEPPGAVVRSLIDRFGERRAFQDTRRALENLAEELAQEPPALAG